VHDKLDFSFKADTSSGGPGWSSGAYVRVAARAPTDKTVAVRATATRPEVVANRPTPRCRRPLAAVLTSSSAAGRDAWGISARVDYPLVGAGNASTLRVPSSATNGRARYATNLKDDSPRAQRRLSSSDLFEHCAKFLVAVTHAIPSTHRQRYRRALEMPLST
jgi:hypothetical protein